MGGGPQDQRASIKHSKYLIQQARRLHLRGKIVFDVFSVGSNLETWLMTMNADGSGLTRIAHSGTNLDFGSPAGSPDGHWIAFADGITGISMIDTHGQRTRKVTRSAPAASSPAWSPDGKQIACSRSLECQEVNGQVSVPCQHPGDGIYVVNVDGSGMRQVAATTAGTSTPSWSPDGKRIVYDTATLESVLSDLWVVHNDGSWPEPLTKTSQSDELEPAWSPDGSLIAFNCGPIGGGSLCTAHTDGTQRRMLASMSVTHPSWSPDGHWIVFLASGTSDHLQDGIWVIRKDGTKLTQIMAWRRFLPPLGWILPDVMVSQPAWMPSHAN